MSDGPSPQTGSALVVEKQLGEVAQVLAVLPLLAAVDLEHADAVLAVDLVAGRMLRAAPLEG